MKKQNAPADIPEIRPGQSIDLLKELHILTRDGKLNQDTRRKLKQVYHLYQFIEPLLENAETLVDHGAGKSYLGFILYDLYFKERASGEIVGIDVDVAVSGTGGGFVRFCRGETQVSNASRPISPKRISRCLIAPSPRAQAKWTSPTGFSAEPPPGPAMPVIASDQSARLCASAPCAIARATASDTAPLPPPDASDPGPGTVPMALEPSFGPEPACGLLRTGIRIRRRGPDRPAGLRGDGSGRRRCRVRPSWVWPARQWRRSDNG